jgi:hypothetical protein
MRTPRRAAVAVVLTIALALGACSSDSEDTTSTTADEAAALEAQGFGPDGRAIQKPAGDPPPPAPERHTGPQGQVGQFVVECEYSHSGPNDPIVHFGMEGMSHQHEFYGFTETDEATTADDMLGGDTTCDKKVDTAAYWHPALYDGDELVEPLDLHAYYRAAPGVDPLDVETMPLGLALIAGDQFATTAQSGDAAGWTCGTRTLVLDDPPTCPASAPLHLVLVFADCWDGEYLDSEDHASHVAYSADGECPDGYPVHIPQLTVTVRFPIYGEGHDLRLASGNVYSAHGDFLNGWDPDGLQREIEACIHRDVVCDLASNRQEEDLFQVQ